ncbi:hypothetical protein HDU97_004554 [Phlyctochytrium planicorne]|nr:hypothetical protein HDU97_004554 [Phlyctochytrium planicorne]
MQVPPAYYQESEEKEKISSFFIIKANMKTSLILLAIIASVLAIPSLNATESKAAAAIAAAPGGPGGTECQCPPPPNRIVGIGQACGGNAWNASICEQRVSCGPGPNPKAKTNSIMSISSYLGLESMERLADGANSLKYYCYNPVWRFLCQQTSKGF